MPLHCTNEHNLPWTVGDPYGGNIRGEFIIDGTRSGRRGVGNRGHGCLRFSFCIVPAIIVYTSRAHGAKLNTLAMPRTHTARGCLPLYTVHTHTHTHTHRGGTQAWWRALPSLGGFYASGTTSNDGRAGGGRAITNICSHESTCIRRERVPSWFS